MGHADETLHAELTGRRTGPAGRHTRPARVFALGGAGEFGRESCEKLATSDLVSEIVIAGRDLEKAERFASELGDKASAVQVDIADERRLAKLMAGSDLVVNTAGPEFRAVLPALRAAIAAGVDYCDLCCLGLITEEALGLDESAKAAGITAVLGAGMVTALTSLLMMHAAQRLDQADELRFCIFQVVAGYGGDPQTLLAHWRELGHADASWQLIARQAAGPVIIYRDGRLLAVDPWEAAVRVTLPQGRSVTAHPLGFPEPITLPRAFPDARSVSVVSSLHPPEANEVYCDFGRRVARGELDESAAAVAFFEYLATLPEQSVAAPEGCEAGWYQWAEAMGTKDGKPARCKCWPVGDWDSTSGPLATVALKILRGEIAAQGVAAPEWCLEPLPFFEEVARWVPELPAGAPLLAERFEELA